MKRRIIYNDDFRTVMSFDQHAYGLPATAQDLAQIVQRVRGTGITTYVMDSIEYDNKVYFATERGTDWTTVDFMKYDHIPEFKGWDGGYGAAGRVMRKMREQDREPLQVVIDSCRDMGIEPVAGVRMNDGHHDVELLSRESPDISFWLKEHPQYTVRVPGTGEPTRYADYSHEGVRDYRFGIIEELLEKFDFNGLELNWLRRPILFQPDHFVGSLGAIYEERFEEVAPIMTAWLKQIRQLLDRTAQKRGKDRLCFGVRVLETPQINRLVGIDLPAWIREAELDYIVPSGFHSTIFNIPVEQFTAMCEGSNCAVIPSLFPNVCHTPKVMRTCQTEVYAAAAANYYAGGAGGVQVFNHFHGATQEGGIPFNSEALTVIASPESVARYPVHHYYITYPVQPCDTPDIQKRWATGVCGLRVWWDITQAFEFYFGEDLEAGDRKLTRLRFKIFEMAPGDGELTTLMLNNIPFTCTSQWRRRVVCRTATLGPGDTQWESAREYKDLELLAGDPITEADAPAMLELLGTSLYDRAEWLNLRKGEGDGIGYHVFKLFEADISSIPDSALHKGMNRIFIRTGARRDGAMEDPYMGELEIVTSTR